MYHTFLIHSSVDGHLGYFQVLDIVTSAVVNIGLYPLSFFAGGEPTLLKIIHLVSWLTKVQVLFVLAQMEFSERQSDG